MFLLSIFFACLRASNQIEEGSGLKGNEQRFIDDRNAIHLAFGCLQRVIVALVEENLREIDGILLDGDVRATGARLIYLPPNGPDLDPIEKACAKSKAALCKAAHRTIDKLLDTIGGHVDAFTPKECDTYFTACG